MNPLQLETPTLFELVSRLTPRQLEVVGLLAEGRTTKETSSILSISRRAVKEHVYRSCEKLGFENRTQLIVCYVMWKVSNHEEKS